MKYIIFDDGTSIVFPDHVDHSRMAGNKKVLSAGFCLIETKRNKYDDIVLKTCICYGESISLKITSHPDDSNILKDIFRNM